MDVKVNGAGRTDAGVHAFAQVASLHGARVKAADLGMLRQDLNDLLPPDIHVLRLDVAPPLVPRAPFRRRAHLPVPDLAAAHRVRQAVRLLGERPPRRLSHAGGGESLRGPARLRKLLRKRGGPRLDARGGRVRARGDAARGARPHPLPHRRFALPVEDGPPPRGDAPRGRPGPSGVADVRALLSARSPEPAAWTAPPSGLFLESVTYAGDPPPPPIDPFRPGF